MRRKKIGTMDFHGSVDITDPCYNRDVWCRMTDVKIRNGVYTCIAWHHKDKGTFDNGEPYCYDVIGIIGIVSAICHFLRRRIMLIVSVRSV